MFDFIADGLTITLSILFPIYASYKALSSSDPALLHPWLIYWVCLAIITTATSILSPIFQFVPFLAWLRLSAHLYLLLPGEQQGAAYIYQTQVEPWLQAHDQDIEHLISTGHDRAKATGLLYFKRAVAFVKAQLLGQSDTTTSSSNSTTSSIRSTPPRARSVTTPQEQQQLPTQTYAASLLARFSLPSARPAAVASATSAAVGGSPDASSRDAALFGLLSSALQAATAAGVISKSSDIGSGSGNPSGATATTPPRAMSGSGNAAAGSGPADAAKYAEGLAALLSAFTKQAGQAGTSADGAASKQIPDRTTSPPVGFEAIEHEDARPPVADEGGVSLQPRPVTSKRRSTSGSGWGGWWAGKKEKAVTVKEGVGESGEKSESRRVSGVKSD